MRQNEWRGALTSMILDVEETLRPMVQVTIHAHTRSHSILSGSAEFETWIQDKTFTIGFLLLAPHELWPLPVTQELIMPDVSTHEMQSTMEAR